MTKSPTYVCGRCDEAVDPLTHGHPPVTTPPTDEQVQVGLDLARLVRSSTGTIAGRVDGANAIAQALADQAAAIHARYQQVAQRCDREAESRSHFAKVEPGYRSTIIPYEAVADWIRGVSP